MLELIIVRGVSGSGKSTMIQNMIENKYKGIGYVNSTDNYFQTSRGYIFEKTKLQEAHSWNQLNAKNQMLQKMTPIFIDNTNCCFWEMKIYVEYGLEFGYEISIVEPKTPWWLEKDVFELYRRNKHGCTIKTIQNMLEKFEPNATITEILNSDPPVR